MSYQVLARKYRPKSFETLVGQEHVVRALSHALEQQRLHHAYLFTGTRGVGKTTLSRILAKSFNCEKGITSQPCGVCGACTAIDAGRFVDYIEMDAASNRGVEEMASLLEQAVYAPSNARFKVYMIDEVHMLTNHAFNSMLKTLEEPPEHVKFILATTDPQKIPVTVLSRCLQFNLKQMPPGHIVSHLDNILGQEHISFEVPALRLLAQGAHGSMRDALSLTDQAIAYAAGKVTLDAVQSMLGALDQSYLIRLLDALALENGQTLISVADEMAARSLSYKAALQDLGSLLHQIAIAQMVPKALAEELPEREELLRLAQVFGKEEIQLFYQIAVHGRNEIGLAPDEYAGFTMCLLRMLAFRPSNVEAGADGKSRGMPRASANLPNATSSIQQSSAASRYVLESKANPIAQSPSAPVTMSAAPIITPLATALEFEKKNTSVAVSPTITPDTNKAAMSPAMAALAAARAGSNKAANNHAGARSVAPVSTASLVPLVAKPEAARPNVVQLDANPTPILKNNRIPESRVNTDVVAQMPPPWEESDFGSDLAMQMSGSEEPRHHKEIQEDDYWAEDALPVQEVRKEVTVPLEATQPSAPTPIQAHAPIEQTRLEQSVSEVPSIEAVKLMPIAELKWDGHWPNLAASLAVRGIAQQLAQQSELRHCTINGKAVIFKLCVPLQTLLSSGSVEKLTAALMERFADCGFEVRVETEIGAVEQTANAQALADRAARLVQAEQAIRSDHFVLSLMRDFGASILTGSIRPI